MVFKGKVEFILDPGAGSGGLGAWGRLVASDEEPLLCWGAFSIEVNNEVLYFDRDRDGRENTVGGGHKSHVMVRLQGCAQRGHTVYGEFHAIFPGAQGCGETPCLWHDSGCTPSTILRRHLDCLQRP